MFTYVIILKGQKLKKLNIVEGNSTIWIPLVHNADTNISLLFSSVSSYKCVQITQTFLQHPLKLGKTLVSLVDKPHKELLGTVFLNYTRSITITNLEFWIYDFLEEVEVFNWEENRQKISLESLKNNKKNCVKTQDRWLTCDELVKYYSRIFSRT